MFRAFKLIKLCLQNIELQKKHKSITCMYVHIFFHSFIRTVSINIKWSNRKQLSNSKHQLCDTIELTYKTAERKLRDNNEGYQVIIENS